MSDIEWTDDKKQVVIDRLDEYSQAKPNGCQEWVAAKNSSGHGRIRVDGTLYYAHRISFEICKTEIEEGNQINHLCDNPSCINPDHLYQGDQKQNVDDAIQRGDFIDGRARGEDNANTKLDWSKVRKIRSEWLSTKISQRDLADKYGVSKGCIQDILEGKTWEENYAYKN